MIAFIVRRLLLFVPVVVGIVFFTFLLVKMAPGSPFSSEKKLSSETLAALNKEYGLDQPFTRQVGLYFRNLARGYLGRSMNFTDRTVNEIIFDALPVSARLGLFSLTVALLVGVPLGAFAAWRRNGWADNLSMVLALIGISLPSFVLASFLVLVFSFWLGWLPAVGFSTPKDLLLPAATLAAPYIAYLSRITRGSLIEVLSQDFIIAARAKGVRGSSILLIHGLKNGIIPVISFLGPASAGILTGSVVVERIFAIPGLGTHFVHSALHRDYFLAVGCALTYGVVLIVCNLVSDLLYAVADPRIAYGGKK